MGFLLGISITLNVISAIAFFIIYRYSLKGVKNKIEDMAIKNFTDFDINFNELEKNLKRGVCDDCKSSSFND